MPKTALQQRITQPRMSIALRLRNPESRVGSNFPRHSYQVEKDFQVKREDDIQIIIHIGLDLYRVFFGIGCNDPLIQI